MKKLFYLPLEMYKERYTEYLSSQRGMFQSKVEALGIELTVYRPSSRLNSITNGVVLDPVARVNWAFQQTECLVSDIMNGFVGDDDVIYFEDFWHPGMEMVPYALHLANKKTKLFAFNHAQSVDPNDFTFDMRSWIRPFEEAWCNRLDGIFCADTTLEGFMLREWKSAKVKRLHATGTVFDHQVLLDIAGEDLSISKDKTVVFSSRWDKEKNPDFFMALVDLVLFERDDINFVVCTGSKELRSNKPELVVEAVSLRNKWRSKRGRFTTMPFSIRTGLSKSDYYAQLRDAKVQFNCASQDFVSYTLLEAATFGCAPLYPNYLSFPTALQHRADHLYRKGDLLDAKAKLYYLLDKTDTTDYRWVYQKYEGSVQRMLNIMGFQI